MDKEELCTSRLDTEEVELTKGTVTVRALSRAEGLTLRSKDKSKPVPLEVMERRMLALAMVNPAMDEGDVARWQVASPAGEIEKVTNVVLRLSGMEMQTDREAYRRFRNR